MSEPLTEAEVRDLVENRGPVMEGIVVYGWDRILTTLVLANVVRKRLLAQTEANATLTSQVGDLTRRLAAAEAAVEEANRRCAADPCVKDEHVGIEERLDRAYAEIRKQTFASKVVFDREIVEEAEKRNPGLRPGIETMP